MFDDRTPERIQAELLEPMSGQIQTREGSFAAELTGPVAVELHKVYRAIAAIIPAIYVDEGSGGFIDLAAGRYGITRKAGAKATASIRFEGAAGAVIPSGTAFLTSAGLEFDLDEDVILAANGLGEGTVTAIEVGERYNVPEGAMTQMLVNRTGLEHWTSGAAQGGAEAETDQALVRRLYDHWRNPSTSGNVHHYEQWALSCDGVGAAKVLPLWAGPGTVKVILASPDREPVDGAVVSAAAEYIETMRPIGAAVTVESAKGLTVNVSASVVTDGSTTLASVKAVFIDLLEEYLRAVAFSGGAVVYNRVTALLLSVPGVSDYSSPKLNGAASNVALAVDQVPVLGTVTLT